MVAHVGMTKILKASSMLYTSISQNQFEGYIFATCLALHVVLLFI